MYLPSIINDLLTPASGPDLCMRLVSDKAMGPPVGQAGTAGQTASGIDAAGPGPVLHMLRSAGQRIESRSAFLKCVVLKPGRGWWRRQGPAWLVQQTLVSDAVMSGHATQLVYDGSQPQGSCCLPATCRWFGVPLCCENVLSTAMPCQSDWCQELGGVVALLLYISPCTAPMWSKRQQHIRLARPPRGSSPVWLCCRL